MGKAFLSHSKHDKVLVEAIAKKLGGKHCIYDTFSFESGQKTIDEIMRGLEDTDLFVIFLSNHSLESEWVKKELNIAFEKLTNSQIKKIFPIIIDKNISYNDPRIPQWLAKEYNLQKNTKSESIKRIIKRLLVEITWEKSPLLKEKNNFFCGRNSLVEILESEYSDFEKNVNCFVASGFPLIGRKALIKHVLEKLKCLAPAHEPLIIKFKDDESVEDFIKKLFDLGIIDFQIEKLNLMNDSQEKKINELVKIIEEFQKIKEIIFIDDLGGIILPNGELVNWFKELLDRLENTQFIFGISSKFNLRKPYNKIANVQVRMLEKDDRRKMFSTLLSLENIDFLENEQKKDICDLFTGYPRQIKYAVELIKNNSSDDPHNFFPDIVQYNSTNVSSIFNEFGDDEKNIIILIAHLGIIEKNFLYEIVEDTELLNKILNKGSSQNIFEYSGYFDYINISENIQDFIIRSNFKILDKFEKRIKKYLDDFKKELKQSKDYKDIDHTVLDIIAVKYLEKNIAIEPFLPSHYLKMIINLYKIKRNYKNVITISEKILNFENILDKYLVKEIRKFRCLALAREKDASVLSEIEKIENKADKSFIKGLYMRQIGKFKDAFYWQCNTLEMQPTYTGAQREIVQIFSITGKIEEALKYAKKLYDESEKNNPYTIQAYLLALIKNKNNKDEKTNNIIKELFKKLEEIGTDTSIEMLDRAKISYKTFFENNSKAIDDIKSLSLKYPDNHYVFMEMFDVADKFENLDLMRESIDKLKELKKKNLDSVISINEIILKKRSGDNFEVDLATIKSKIPEEIYNKLYQRLYNRNI